MIGVKCKKSILSLHFAITRVVDHWTWEIRSRASKFVIHAPWNEEDHESISRGWDIQSKKPGRDAYHIGKKEEIEVIALQSVDL